MEARTEDFYFAIVSGEIEELYTAASAEAPEGVNVEDVDRKGPYWNIEAAEPTFIPVPVLTDPDHKKYLDPLELDALLGSTVSDRAREWEYKKAVSIWQHYRDNSGSAQEPAEQTDGSRRLDDILNRVYICLSILAEKYGFSASLPTLTTGGSTQEPAEQTGGSAQDPAGQTAADPQSHDVPDNWPDILRTEKAIKLAYKLETMGYLNTEWKPGPKLYFDGSKKLNKNKATYIAKQFRDHLKKGQSYSPVFCQFWELEKNDISHGRLSEFKGIPEIETLAIK